MDAAQIAKTFWQQGYVVLNNFFVPSQMDQMRVNILAHYGKSPKFAHDDGFIKKSATEVVPWILPTQSETVFGKIEQDPRLIALTEQILGPQWRSLYCMTMFSPQGSRGQAWHQDCPVEDSDRFNLNRLVYSMEIDDQLGGEIVVKPGSHLQGELSVGDVDETFADQQVLKPSKGALVFIHGHTWHRVLPIKGPYRVSTNYRAVPFGTPQDITDICVYRNMRYQFSTSQVLQERTR